MNEMQAVGNAVGLRDWLATPEVSAKLLAVAGGREADVKRVQAMACIAVTENELLLRCDRYSVLKSVMRSVELGLAIGDPVRAEAYLVPFGGTCTLMPGYRGLMKLARRSGEIGAIYSYAVYKGDTFAPRLGDNPGVEHVPDWKTPKTDANIVAFYAVAAWKDGFRDVEIMHRSEVDSIRAGVERKNRGNLPDPWKYAYAEQGRKSALRRICKRLPLTPEAEAFIHETEREEMDDLRESVKVVNPLLAASERASVGVSPAETSEAVGVAAEIDAKIAERLPQIDADEIDRLADKQYKGVA